MKKIILLLLFPLSVTYAGVAVADYSQHPEVGSFIERMVNEHKFDRQQVKNWMSQARHQKSIVDAMSRPAEKVKTWYDYRKIFITDLRIERGVEFWQENYLLIKNAGLVHPEPHGVRQQTCHVGKIVRGPFRLRDV